MPDASRIRPTLLVFAMCLILAPIEKHTAQAQSDLPPVGHSRFDRLIGNAPVPYPFARLVQTINRQMQQDSGGLPPLKITLIPLGRSLQREAGAPDFFAFPRVVAAADGSNLAGAEPLKDRLFIGYHEKGRILEVISYNDEAGRFEFQIVRDYQAGKTPQVFYARRSLCLACHQNAAPIFARPLWDETPANPAIAARLRQTRRDFYGVKLTGTDIAYFIDAATDRANLFSVWQTLWEHGCGEGEAGARCRKEAFAAALEYARAGVLPTPALLPRLDQNGRTRWPQGLSIPNPDLPNRDPLAAMQDSANDPLLLRPPLTHWHAPDKTAFIVGLAGMLDSALIKKIKHRDVGAALERLRARGEFTHPVFSQALLHALLAELGLPRPGASSKLPPARTEARSQDTGTRTIFRTHCASCHDTPLPHPPNFLHGSPAAVEAQLTHCAARIFFRLSMAHVPEVERNTSPMPPAAALANRGIQVRQWAQSAELAALKRSIETRLPPQTSTRLLQQPYASLQPCLPPAAYARHAP